MIRAAAVDARGSAAAEKAAFVLPTLGAFLLLPTRRLRAGLSLQAESQAGWGEAPLAWYAGEGAGALPLTRLILNH